MSQAETKSTAPWVKPALEFGPILAFFAAYIALKDNVFTIGGTEYSGFIAVTAMFIPLLIASTLALWRITGKLSAMQIVTLVLVVVFGGLTIWLNDERFFKMKPTIIYTLFAAMLGFGLLRKRSYLEVVMGEVMPLDPEGWMKITRRMAALFAGLALANEFVWRTMQTDTWVQFKTFGLPLIMIAFFATQSRMMAEHSTEEDDAEET